MLQLINTDPNLLINDYNISIKFSTYNAPLNQTNIIENQDITKVLANTNISDTIAMNLTTYDRFHIWIDLFSLFNISYINIKWYQSSNVEYYQDSVVYFHKYTYLKMSDYFYYQQRWFTTIELTTQYFLPGQGIGNFGGNPKMASNVIIKNGVIKIVPKKIFF